jgi:hypothetical protein
MSEIEASAEAVKAVAETTGKAIDASRDLGGFLSRIIGGTLEELGGMLHDTVRFRREVRLLRFHQRFEQLRAEAGIASPIKPLELKAAIPLIQAASLEEDDELQDMFARLLVNGTDPESGIEARRTLVTILQDFGPLEARLLKALCDAPSGPLNVRTAGLPDRYLGGTEEEQKMVPPVNIEVALWNLVRLGCIEPVALWGGGTSVASVSVNALGHALMDACTVRRKGEDMNGRHAQPTSSLAGINWGTKWQSGLDGPLEVKDEP